MFSRILPWVPTVNCRDSTWSNSTPTPAPYDPCGMPLRRWPTRAVVAALRNGVPWRCWCLPGRCQGKLGVIEGFRWPAPQPTFSPPDWVWGPAGERIFPWPWLLVTGSGAATGGMGGAPLVVTAAGLLPGQTSGLVLVENTSGAPLTITVPPGIEGQQLTIKDALGVASVDPITVVCQPTVDGSPSYLLASNFASLRIYWMGRQWGTL